MKNVLLLIEDNPLLVGIYKAAFEKKNVKVLFAHNGSMGIAIAKKEKPDIIVSDILMPKMDGFEVLKELKKDNATKDIKVIILTIVKEEASIKKAKKLGALDYLIKSELKLHEIVEKVLAYIQ